jgi:hypothetical protein
MEGTKEWRSSALAHLNNSLKFSRQCLNFLAELVATNVTSHIGTDVVELSYILRL